MEVGRTGSIRKFFSGWCEKKKETAKFLNEFVFLFPFFFCVFWVPEVYQFFIALFAVSLAADSLMSGF